MKKIFYVSLLFLVVIVCVFVVAIIYFLISTNALECKRSIDSKYFESISQVVILEKKQCGATVKDYNTLSINGEIILQVYDFVDIKDLDFDYLDSGMLVIHISKHDLRMSDISLNKEKVIVLFDE